MWTGAHRILYRVISCTFGYANLHKFILYQCNNRGTRRCISGQVQPIRFNCLLGKSAQLCNQSGNQYLVYVPWDMQLYIDIVSAYKSAQLCNQSGNQYMVYVPWDMQLYIDIVSAYVSERTKENWCIICNICMLL